MPAFVFRAQYADGREQSGTLEAGSYHDLIAHLESRGLFLISSREEATVAAPPRPAASPRPPAPAVAAAPRRGFPARSRVRRRELIFLFRQLHLQLATGIPLLECLGHIRELTGNRELRTMIDGIADAIKEGKSLSAAMREHPTIIPPALHSMVYSGEQSGKMHEVLQRIQEYLERQDQLAHQIRSALIYPVFIVATALGTLFFMTLFILPRFLKIFSDRAQELPPLTRGIILLGNFVETNRWPILGVALALAVAGWLAKHLAGKNRRVDVALLRLPLLGEVLRRTVLTRFAGSLAMLLGSGVNILQALSITRNVVGNRHVGETLDRVHEELKKGQSLSGAMAAAPFFPSLMVGMVATGERTGTLAQTLRQMNDYYEQELAVSIRDFFSMLEPILIIVLGVGIGAIAIGLLLPIFELYSLDL